jgi:hypothetical protein
MSLATVVVRPTSPSAVSTGCAESIFSANPWLIFALLHQLDASRLMICAGTRSNAERSR